MAGIELTIEVDVPTQAAYALWADFEGQPRFVENAERVTRDGDRLHWVAKAGPSTREWDAVVVAEEPGRRLAWRAPDGPIDTEILFEPLDGGRTRVTFRETMHDSLGAQALAATGIADRRARADLERYKELAEG